MLARCGGPPEEKVPRSRLEAAGILWACKHFKPYLVGREFVIRTDHKPLLSLNLVDGQALEKIRVEMEEFLPYKVELYRESRCQPMASLGGVKQSLPTPLSI